MWDQDLHFSTPGWPVTAVTRAPVPSPNTRYFIQLISPLPLKVSHGHCPIVFARKPLLPLPFQVSNWPLLILCSLYRSCSHHSFFAGWPDWVMASWPWTFHPGSTSAALISASIFQTHSFRVYVVLCKRRDTGICKESVSTGGQDKGFSISDSQILTNL